VRFTGKKKIAEKRGNLSAFVVHRIHVTHSPRTGEKAGYLSHSLWSAYEKSGGLKRPCDENRRYIYGGVRTKKKKKHVSFGNKKETPLGAQGKGGSVLIWGGFFGAGI